MKPVRTLIVDDHTIFRKGIRTILSEFSDIEVVGEAQDGLEAIKQAKILKPELMLMDIHMPNLDGLQALERIRSEEPSIQIVMLTVSEDANDLFTALKNGARGYILKNITPAELHQKIIAMKKGEAPISGMIAAKIIQEFRAPDQTQEKKSEPDAAHQFEDLSEREYEVLAMVSQGMTNQEIAKALFITESTVKTHLRVILEKLHLKNRVQAAVYAAKHNLTRKT